MVRNWLYYTGGAIGLGILSGWLFRHSQLSGSNDLNQWTKEGVDAATAFFGEHVQQPVLISYTKPIVQSCCDLRLGWIFS